MERSGLAPPPEAVAARENGHLFNAGRHLGWVFGREDGEEYIEWVSDHRMADMHHERLYANGDSVLLEAPFGMHTISGEASDDEIAKLGGVRTDRNRHLHRPA